MKVRKWSKCVSSILTLTSVLNGTGAPRPCCRMCLLATSKRCDVSPGMYLWIFFSETKSAMIASTCFLVLHPVAFWYVSANASVSLSGPAWLPYKQALSWAKIRYF